MSVIWRRDLIDQFPVQMEFPFVFNNWKFMYEKAKPEPKYMRKPEQQLLPLGYYCELCGNQFFTDESVSERMLGGVGPLCDICLECVNDVYWRIEE